MMTSDVYAWSLLLIVLLGAALYHQIGKYHTKRILAKAHRAEKKAIYLLRKEGYRVLRRQLREEVEIRIDGKPHTSIVKADLLVAKGPFRYIAEVKTGQKTSAQLPLVRRQLLDYYLTFRPHGVLLIDMERETIKHVQFRGLDHRGPWSLLLGLVLSVLIFGLGFYCHLLFFV